MAHRLKAETLNKINEARTRLEEHQYGWCFECGDEIAEARAPDLFLVKGRQSGALLSRVAQGWE